MSTLLIKDANMYVTVYMHTKHTYNRHLNTFAKYIYVLVNSYKLHTYVAIDAVLL